MRRYEQSKLSSTGETSKAMSIWNFETQEESVLLLRLREEDIIKERM